MVCETTLYRLWSTRRKRLQLGHQIQTFKTSPMLSITLALPLPHKLAPILPPLTTCCTKTRSNKSTIIGTTWSSSSRSRSTNTHPSSHFPSPSSYTSRRIDSSKSRFRTRWQRNRTVAINNCTSCRPRRNRQWPITPSLLEEESALADLTQPKSSTISVRQLTPNRSSNLSIQCRSNSSSSSSSLRDR